MLSVSNYVHVISWNWKQVQSALWIAYLYNDWQKLASLHSDQEIDCLILVWTACDQQKFTSLYSDQEINCLMLVWTAYD